MKKGAKNELTNTRVHTVMGRNVAIKGAKIGFPVRGGAETWQGVSG